MMRQLRAVEAPMVVDLAVDYGAYVAIGLALVALIVLVITHPDRWKRSIRRSIRLGWPLALGITLAPDAPLPMFKPTIGADVPVEVGGTTERHADCFVDATDDAVLLACLRQVDAALYALRRGENGG